MYTTGDLKRTTPPCEEYIAEEWCDESYDEDGHGKHEIHDSATGITWEAGDFVVYLPHSCSEWVIGGEEQVKALIADLEQMLAVTGELYQIKGVSCLSGE